jgi:hypothetical protein
MEDLQDLYHQQQLEHQEQLSRLAYCDYIAHRIKETMNKPDPQKIIYGAGSVKFNLNAEGQFVSTKKHLFVTDCNGRMYKITVEEV